jgi:shikimate dehydrogenase
MHIDGRTKLAGVLGWPVAHSLSPAMHNAAFHAMRLPWAYIPLAVEKPLDVPDVVKALRALPFVGFNVTMPYKRIALELCDDVAALAKLAGAVNTVRCEDGALIGYNTDGRGMLASLAEEAGLSAEGRRFTMLGAGGAAGSALAAMVLAGAAKVTVVARHPQAAQDLVDRIRPHARDTELVALEQGPANGPAFIEADVVVNATPVGMAPRDPLPVNPHWLHAGQIVCDMIYAPMQTRLLEEAQRAGATAVGGLGMLVHQGAMALELWNAGSNESVPRDVMRRAAEHVIAERTCQVETERSDG